ncbi:hypothetical protein [Rickettsia akari]|uniref:hypothetical protein n=1 Tax=Rickettsia akari TaxID=786 RepID=UPI00004622B4|nr:hypothetical protein [Rickettsia akari]
MVYNQDASKMEKDYLNRMQLYGCYTYVSQIKQGMKHKDLLPVVIIAMIILYGSSARGDWVYDLPNWHNIYTDILIILIKGKYKGYTALKLKDRIYKRLEKT